MTHKVYVFKSNTVNQYARTCAPKLNARIFETDQLLALDIYCLALEQA